MHRLDYLSFAQPFQALTQRLRTANQLWWAAYGTTEEPTPYTPQPRPPARLCLVCGSVEGSPLPCLFGHQAHTYPVHLEEETQP